MLSVTFFSLPGSVVGGGEHIYIYTYCPYLFIDNIYMYIYMYIYMCTYLYVYVCMHTTDISRLIPQEKGGSAIPKHPHSLRSALALRMSMLARPAPPLKQGFRV